MRTLEIANIPDELYEQIEKLARIHGRSVSEEAVAYLTRGLTHDDEREAALMEEIRREREAMAQRGVRVTTAQIKDDRNWGRD